jgi:hypothetical protein
MNGLARIASKSTIPVRRGSVMDSRTDLGPCSLCAMPAPVEHGEHCGGESSGGRWGCGADLSGSPSIIVTNGLRVFSLCLVCALTRRSPSLQVIGDVEPCR